MYIIWGRTSCPNGSTLVYNGSVASSFSVTKDGVGASNSKGRNPAPPPHPDSKHTAIFREHESRKARKNTSLHSDSQDGEAFPLCLPHISIDYVRRLHPRQRDLFEKKYSARVRLQNVPCSMCEATGRKTTFMLPGTNKCPAGWVREYHGYIMADRSHQHSSHYLCVEVSFRDMQLSKGHAFANVWMTCSPPLSCQPVQNLTCTVCSK